MTQRPITLPALPEDDAPFPSGRKGYLGSDMESYARLAVLTDRSTSIPDAATTPKEITLPTLPTFMTTNLCGAMQEWCDADPGDDAGAAFEYVVARFGQELRRYASAAVEADRAENNYERGYADGLASRADIARLQQEIDTLRSDREAGRSAPVAWVDGRNLASAQVSRERGGPFDSHAWSECKTAIYGTPLYPSSQLALTHDQDWLFGNSARCFSATSASEFRASSTQGVLLWWSR